VSSTVNRGVSAARGKYAAFLHDDDYFLAGKPRAAVLALDRNPDAVLIFSDYSMIDSESDEPIEDIRFDHAPKPGRNVSQMGNCGPPSTILVRRECFEA
jgi:glycosyltransferase involved in cell wall biosynthesis